MPRSYMGFSTGSGVPSHPYVELDCVNLQANVVWRAVQAELSPLPATGACGDGQYAAWRDITQDRENIYAMLIRGLNGCVAPPVDRGFVKELALAVQGQKNFSRHITASGRSIAAQDGETNHGFGAAVGVFFRLGADAIKIAEA